MFEYFLKSVAIGDITEFCAAVAGTIFFAQMYNPPKALRQFTYFLWFVMISEIFGFYGIYAYVTEYVTLPFIKDTPFRRAIWIYNVFIPFTYCFFILFFRARLKSAKMKKIILYALGFFVVSTSVYWLFSKDYLYTFSPFTEILGTFLLCSSILIYFWEILLSSDILLFYKRFSFYAAIGILIRYLVATPLFIYTTYFSPDNPEFIRFFVYMLTTANLFMYGSFVIGFIVCYKNRELVFKKTGPEI